MPHSSWQTQKAAVSCLTAAVETHPDLAYTLLDILESTIGKVSVRRHLFVLPYSSYLMLELHTTSLDHVLIFNLKTLELRCWPTIDSEIYISNSPIKFSPDNKDVI